MSPTYNFQFFDCKLLYNLVAWHGLLLTPGEITGLDLWVIAGRALSLPLPLGSLGRAFKLAGIPLSVSEPGVLWEFGGEADSPSLALPGPIHFPHYPYLAPL